MILRTIPRSLTRAEYLDIDAEARDIRYEYHGDRVVACIGASAEHSFVKDNIRSELHQFLRERGYKIMTSTLRVQAGERYVYPDVVALCQTPRFTEETPSTLLNPVFLAEVTSPSTRDLDMSEKRDVYLDLASLREYWIVETDRPYISQYTRHDGNWIYRTVKGHDAGITCEAFGVDLPLAKIYADVLPEPR